MNILAEKEIKAADTATMKKEGISGLELMERAAERMVSALENRMKESGLQGTSATLAVFCGKGNNGGDGFAMARLLSSKFKVVVVPLFPEAEMTPDCKSNYRRLPADVAIFPFENLVCSGNLWNGKTVIVDAMLGSGTAGPIRGNVADAVELVNSIRKCRKDVLVVSVDLPSGLPTEPFKKDCRYDSMNSAVIADITLTVGFPKLSLLFPETGKYAGTVEVVDIGLDRDYIDSHPSGYEWTDDDMIASLMPERNVYDHKGRFGHLLVVAGSEGMAGASLLCTGAALKSGCGLVTACIPEKASAAMYSCNPSAMQKTYGRQCFPEVPGDLHRYSAVTVGPGIGRSASTASALSVLLDSAVRLVLDADALNIISSDPALFSRIPAGSVLTPHIGELSRLIAAFFGMKEGFPVWDGEFDKVAKVRKLASSLGSVVVVKGAHTMICCPDGRLVFNMTGNPGMAKGGSGDVLAGLAGGLMARGLAAEDAAVLAVWLHGKAGDSAAARYGREAMNASDILSEIRF